MVGKSIKGTNNCFVCNYELNWETKIVNTMNSAYFVVQTVPEITARETAIGRNEDGTINYEILCACPRCKTQNKFIAKSSIK